MKWFSFFGKKETEQRSDQPASSPLPPKPSSLPEQPFKGITLSSELLSVAPQILQSGLPFVRIKATPAETLGVTQSKFAGVPYWPKGLSYPTDSEGQYLFLLAQINFAEVPPLAGYTGKGILQFFISVNDVYGIDFDNPTSQKDFRLVFHEEVDEANAEKEFAFLNTMDLKYVPLDKMMQLRFEPDVDYVGVEDVRFEKNFGLEVLPFTEQFGEKGDDVFNELYELFPNEGHKIGGYAYFTQADPRQSGPYEDWILLLQIDSQDGIMWGDMGVANFFIHPNDLENRNFSNVLYNWDCT